VIRLLADWDSPSHDPRVVAEPVVTKRHWVRQLEEWSPGFDLVWIQHEFGIFGPADGISVLDVCRRSPLPLGATLHTVLSSPTTRQRSIIEGIGEMVEVLVVMSREARRRLIQNYDIDEAKAHVIPHGAQFPSRRRHRHENARPVIVNWGLIGRGKGLETGIRAMSHLRHLTPAPRLVIRGTTHPKVKRREGDRYRDGLVQLINDLDLADSVEIIDGYLSSGELETLLRSADMALVPYDTTEQATSGVLIDAVGAGLPVVATAFPHAIELLSGGAGLVVPQRDPKAMAAAIESLLTEPSALESAADAAMRVGHDLAWPRIAVQYDGLARQICAPSGSRVAVAS
jgi:glycosyltransferase involved in cell wall biosynthesis